MSKTIALVLRLLVGYFLIRKFLFMPPKKQDKQGFRKRYEARKKEKLNAGDEGLHQNGG